MADVGKAYVEVLADAEKFPEDLRGKMKAAAAEATGADTFRDMEDNMAKAGEEGATRMADSAAKEGEKKMKESGKKSGSGFIAGFKGVMGGLAAATLPSLILWAASVVSYIGPAVGALGAALPAVASVGIVSMLTLKTAIAGVGQSIAALSSGTKLTAAQLKQFQQLAPAAQAFVKIVAAAKPQLEAFKQGIQQAFFAELTPQMHGLLALLPMLTSDFKAIASALGSIAVQVAHAFSGNKGALDEVLTGIAYILRDIGPMLAGLVRIFLNVAAVAMPFVDQLLMGMSNWLDRIDVKVRDMAGSGGLADFFSAALVILRNLGGALSQIFGLIGAIGHALGAVGGTSLSVLGTVLKQLTDFFRTPVGQQTLITLVSLINTVLISLGQLIAPLLPVVGKLIIALGPQLQAILTNLVPPLAKIVGDFANLLPILTPILGVITPLAKGLGMILDFLSRHPAALQAAVIAWGAYKAALLVVAGVEALVDALDPVTWIILLVAAIAIAVGLILMNWDKIKKWAGEAWDAIKRAFNGVVDWFKGVGDAIGKWVAGVIQWFAELPTKIHDFLTSLPGLVEQIFARVADRIQYWLGFAFGWVLGQLITLPSRIWQLLLKLPQLFDDAWHAIYNFTLQWLTTLIQWLEIYFVDLPIKIGLWLLKLPDMIKSAWDSVKDWTGKKLAELGVAIGTFFGNLPGTLQRMLVNAGKSIGNFLKDGINSAIDGINAGLDKAGVPSSLRLPHLASGALLRSPTVALIGEAGPEVVIPLNKPQRAQQLADQSGLSSMLNTGLQAAQMTFNVLCQLDSGDLIRVINVQVTKGLDNEAHALATSSHTGGF